MPNGSLTYDHKPAQNSSGEGEILLVKSLFWSTADTDEHPNDMLQKNEV